MMNEMRKVEKEHLDEFELNKSGLKFDKDSSIDEIKAKLFGERFCFLLEIKAAPILDIFSTNHSKLLEKRLFKLCLIITDFYLNEDQIDTIK